MGGAHRGWRPSCKPDHMASRNGQNASRTQARQPHLSTRNITSSIYLISDGSRTLPCLRWSRSRGWMRRRASDVAIHCPQFAGVRIFLGTAADHGWLSRRIGWVGAGIQGGSGGLAAVCPADARYLEGFSQTPKCLLLKVSESTFLMGARLPAM